MGDVMGDVLQQSVSPKIIEQFYRDLYRIRRVEEEIAKIYPTDKIMSPVHLSIGQEAIPVAVCASLHNEDIAYGSYRCHALYLSKGGDLKRMIAELYGKATGCAKGKAGSMHLIDKAAGVMGASAVVATTIPLAVGHALAVKMKGEKKIVVCFFGDGAVEEGAFHESLNFAALKRLPILFICENNFYAIHAKQEQRQHRSKITELAIAEGVPSEKIERMDVLELKERVAKAVQEIRGGSGPQLLECMCYRWMEHVGPNQDFHVGYRDRVEAEPWFEDDQVRRMKEMSGPAAAKIEKEVEAEIAAAFADAEAAPFPDAAELYTDLYKDA